MSVSVPYAVFIILFSGGKQLKTGMSGKHTDHEDSSREDEDKVKNSIWDFGKIEIFPIRNGSPDFKVQNSFVFLGWNIYIEVTFEREKIKFSSDF